MKNSLRIGLAAVALTFIFSFFCVTETKAQMVTEILNRMDTHYKALQSLRTDVTTDKFNSQLGEHNIMEGKAIYLSESGLNALLRVDWTKPREEYFGFANKKFIVYRPQLNQAIVGNLVNTQNRADVNSPLAFMNMTKAELIANYNIKYLGEEKVNGTISTWHLDLTPKSRPVQIHNLLFALCNPTWHLQLPRKTASNFKTVSLWVDGNGMPIQMKVIENNNDSTTVLLTNLEKNANINTKVFKIILPKGTKIIRN